MQERREISKFDSDEKMIKNLFILVAKGSIYENTSIMVPTSVFVRKVWTYRDGSKDKSLHCVIDVDSDIINESSFVVKGSESLFRKALEMTVIRNIPHIKDVVVLEKGIPDKNLWEM